MWICEQRAMIHVQNLLLRSYHHLFFMLATLRMRQSEIRDKLSQNYKTRQWQKAVPTYGTSDIFERITTHKVKY